MPTSAPSHKKKISRPAKTAVKKKVVPQESSNAASPMNTERLRRLYSTMLKCRLVAESCDRVFGTNVAAAKGHEAVEVGACIHLREEDLVSPTSGLINGNITKGASVSHLFTVLKASSHTAGENAASLSSLKLSSRAQIEASTIVALSHKLSLKSIVDMAIVGSAADKSGNTSPSDATHDFWENSVQFAGARKLGIVYLICTSIDSDHDLRGRALEFQIPGIVVDGNDVVAVYRVAEESVRRAREGHGPTLIDCKIDPSRDPLSFMEDYLKKRDMWSDKWHAKVMQELKKEIEKIRLVVPGKMAV
jgi:TPP-dependent pyruvate/acetoin dehydrogenase alpha subunit